MNLKDTLKSLKAAREKCVNTVDKGTLNKIDEAIHQLELIEITESKPNKMQWLTGAIKILSLIKLLTDNIDFGG
ncbi:hypothetical protein GNP61_14865 [Aliivibrio fischeri]|uniref:hypothetical protein n=1 Tax=Aliivibrio fischeri TaxID=668 RepID=UPI0012DA044D|nr:hypothetical protein [Aliivibrio fischeri]MUK42836.1 hypothetical protein [Aliivibrio fischeri]